MNLPVTAVPGLRPFAPRIDRFSRHFWQQLEHGLLLASRCTACDWLTFPPKRRCPRCLADQFKWQTLQGQGTLYTFTRVHAGAEAFAAWLPYWLAVIDTAEEVRLVTRLLVGPGREPVPGMAVQLAVQKFEDGPLFVAQLETQTR
ncbi:MAG: OB-fold domain-containing protein [Steroidobacteraceae bacterium]